MAASPEPHLSADASATLTFDGELPRPSFTAFAAARARRLDLDLVFWPIRAGSITVSVRGQRDLVDAFEAACTLGPSDCLVRGVTRR
jgi:acylphosphatase